MVPLPDYLAIILVLFNAYKFILMRRNRHDLEEILSIPTPNYQSNVSLLQLLKMVVHILKNKAKGKKNRLLKPELMLRLLRGYRLVLINLFGCKGEFGQIAHTSK